MRPANHKALVSTRSETLDRPSLPWTAAVGAFPAAPTAPENAPPTPTNNRSSAAMMVEALWAGAIRAVSATSPTAPADRRKIARPAELNMASVKLPKLISRPTASTSAPATTTTPAWRTRHTKIRVSVLVWELAHNANATTPIAIRLPAWDANRPTNPTVPARLVPLSMPPKKSSSATAAAPSACADRVSPADSESTGAGYTSSSVGLSAISRVVSSGSVGLASSSSGSPVESTGSASPAGMTCSRATSGAGAVVVKLNAPSIG